MHQQRACGVLSLRETREECLVEVVAHHKVSEAEAHIKAPHQSNVA